MFTMEKTKHLTNVYADGELIAKITSIITITDKRGFTFHVYRGITSIVPAYCYTYTRKIIKPGLDIDVVDFIEKINTKNVEDLNDELMILYKFKYLLKKLCDYAEKQDYQINLMYKDDISYASFVDNGVAILSTSDESISLNIVDNNHFSYRKSDNIGRNYLSFIQIRDLCTQFVEHMIYKYANINENGRQVKSARNQ